jgi:flagellar FliL protein
MAENTEEEKPAGSKKKLFIIIGAVVLVLLIGGGVAGFFLLKKEPPPVEEKTGTNVPVPDITNDQMIGPMVDIEEFIVNIISADSNHYVKASLTVELTNEETREEVESRMPQMRDAILLLLGNKTYEELQDLQGKRQLKAEIISRINSFLQAGKVKSVYFTNFVVQ